MRQDGWEEEGELTIQLPLGPQPVKQEVPSQGHSDARQRVPGAPGGGTALVRERMVVRTAREGRERSILFWCCVLVDGFVEGM